MSRDDSEGWQFEADEVEDDEVTEEAAEEADDGWRFSLEDLEADERAGEDDDQSAVGGNVFGSLESDTEVIEAGSPNPENVLFVAVGLLVALAVFAEFFLLFT